MNRTFHSSKLILDQTVFVAPGATLVGDVTIGRHASVWFHATVRGDVAPISIGAESNVQDGCVIHVDSGCPTRIGERVTMGHGAIVHGSEVSDDVIIGMRAVVLSNCRVGRHSLVGSGAVLSEGTIVPEGSLVLGIPARVVRTLRSEEIERIHENARIYVDLARAYREGTISIPGAQQ